MRDRRTTWLVSFLLFALALAGCRAADVEQPPPPAPTLTATATGMAVATGTSAATGTATTTPLPLAPRDEAGDPQTPVRSFYDWYLAYDGDPVATGAFVGRPELAPGLTERVAAALAAGEGPPYDPFLCAHETPAAVSVAAAERVQDEAQVTLTGDVAGHRWVVELALFDGAWRITDVVCDGPEVDRVHTWRVVTLPEAGATFDAPAEWPYVFGHTAWSPEGSDAYVGFRTATLVPPAEVEAALFPSPLAPAAQAVVRGRSALQLNAGEATAYQIEVAADASDEDAGVETHVVLVLEESGLRRAYDLYAGAASATELARWQPVLDHMAATLTVDPEAVVPAGAAAVVVFFDNAQLNPEAACNAVFPVGRVVPADADPVAAALYALFGGPTLAEIDAGYGSFFSEATAGSLRGVKIEGETAYVNLDDIRDVVPGVSSSCGSQAFMTAVQRTVQAAAPQVQQVRYAIAGDPAHFYEWVQLGCDGANDRCDAAPFADLEPGDD